MNDLVVAFTLPLPAEALVLWRDSPNLQIYVPSYAILEGRDRNNNGKTGDAMSWPELQTMQTTYRLIAQGERPWNALGDFLNYWFGYATDRRTELVREPIQEPEEVTADLHRWAAFCAASVEYLCERYELPCPDWALKSTYTLTDPWFTGLGAERPHSLRQAQYLLRQPHFRQ